jgi:serine/threonine protein kinase
MSLWQHRTLGDDSVRVPFRSSFKDDLFDLTGKTGSYFYMAPEVVLGQPYNEKARRRCAGAV